MDHLRVTDILRAVAGEHIQPRFRDLSAADVRLKGPGDYVTAADVAAEVALAPLLTAVLDVPVVGEEASAADRAVMNAVSASKVAWVVDPIDGTANFVAGSADYASMVGLVRADAAAAGWILHPESGDAYFAETGAGAWVQLRDRTQEPRRFEAADFDAHGPLRGAVAMSRAPQQVRDDLAAAQTSLGVPTPLRNCCGFDYIDLATGAIDYLLYFATMPWDHVPGAVIASEAGCVVARLDGSDYRASVTTGAPLLAARAEVFDRVRAEFARAVGLVGSH